MSTRREFVRAVATRHRLPDSPVEQPARPGGVNDVIVVGAGDERYVLRTPRQPRPPEEFAVEAWCSSRARELGVSTPPILHTGVLGGRSYSVQRWVRGADGESRRTPELWRTLGRYAKTIADVPLDEAPPTLFSRFGRRLDAAWRAHIRYNLDQLGRDDPLVDLGVYQRTDRARLRETFLRLERWNLRHGLVHGDLALRNLIVPPEPSASPVLLDWGSATTGPLPHLDLVLLLGNRDERANPTDLEIAHFLEGYGRQDPPLLAEIQEVRLLQAVDLTRWALAHAPDRVAQTASPREPSSGAPPRPQHSPRPELSPPALSLPKSPPRRFAFLMLVLVVVGAAEMVAGKADDSPGCFVSGLRWPRPPTLPGRSGATRGRSTMSDGTTTAEHPVAEDSGPPPKWKIVGPGLLVAATGVGAADLVATLIAGQKYGYALLWVAVLGCILKIILVEGAGRYTLSTQRSIFEGWRSLGLWTTIYFVPYIILWGFVYGAAAMSSTALPLAALFPQVPLPVFAIASGLIGLALVWFGRYAFFEKVCAVLVALMFVTVVGAAVVTLPNLLDVLGGLVPRIPDGSMINVLSVAGGVGGTITLAAYGYWLREKGWHSPRWMKVMRLDNRMAYLMTGIFVVSMLIVGAELLNSAQIAVSTGDRGLLDLSRVLTERYGRVFGTFFLVGFWAASFSSLIGVWNGVSLMFADFVGHARHLPPGHPDTRTGGRYFKAYILWLTLPPMLLLLLGQPVAIILAYGVLGSLFMPFLAITLVWLLNSDRVPQQWRNRWRHNVGLGLVTLFFVALGVYQLYDTIAG